MAECVHLAAVGDAEPEPETLDGCVGCPVTVWFGPSSAVRLLSTGIESAVNAEYDRSS